MNALSNRRVAISALLARGKALRSDCPRSSHGEWAPRTDRPSPLAMLAASNEGRVPDLVPIRYGRMRRSAFAFFRGSSNIMAYDLGTSGHTTGIELQACGDCHVENFGIFATPERNLVFDINDFDETISAPWEWDVKRLAASIHVAARTSGTSERRAAEAVRAAIRAYRESLRQCSTMTKLEVWYARIDASEAFAIAHAAAALRDAATESAPDDAHELIAEQYTSGDGLGRRIVDKPPKLFHPPPDGEVVIDAGQVLSRYRDSLRDDIAVLMDAYELVDMAVKVVGIGSVGTRCAVALLMAHDNDGLILQIKEARRSVLEPYAQPCTFENQGQRVVAGQRIMQTASDIFLGWSDSDDGHHFYVRQLSDMKGSIDAATLTPAQLLAYAALCGKTLALTHARSGDPATLAGYLGKSTVFDRAIASFAATYADLVETDYTAFIAAIECGNIEARDG